MSTTTHEHVPRNFAPTTRRASVSLVLTWSGGVQAVALREDAPLVVGRGEPSHVVLNDRSLSRRHARFSLMGRTVSVEDLESTNGTLVDGVAIRSATLAPYATVQLGAVEARLSGVDEARDESADVDRFMQFLQREVVRAGYLDRELALLAVECSPHQQHLVRRALRPIDLALARSPRVMLCMVPDTSESEMRQLAKTIAADLSGPCRFGLALFSPLACSADELADAALAALRHATQGELGIAPAARVESEQGLQPMAASMARIHSLIERVARTTIPVLITGETGSGKERMAALVHEKSLRCAGPLKAVNCAALAPNLLSSTLFGHERGAFTGADRPMKGLFEQCHGGTLFLDEVAELSGDAQGALLRVLETKRVTRLGSASEHAVDVRVVAATHRDLAQLVSQGQFREDLLYRLDAFSVRVPPLRERREEIIPLAQHFLRQSREAWGCRAHELAPGVMETLMTYHWPGNIRQLRNVIERAASVAQGATVELDDLPESIFEALTTTATAAPTPAAAVIDAATPSLPDQLRAFEQERIRAAIEQARGNMSEAARLLGLPRRTLSHKAQHYGISRER